MCPVCHPSPKLGSSPPRHPQTRSNPFGNFVYFETSKNENNVSPWSLPAQQCPLSAMMMIIISACQLCVKVTFLQGWPILVVTPDLTGVR